MHTLARSLVGLLLVAALLRGEPPAVLPPALPPEGAAVAHEAGRPHAADEDRHAGHILFDGQVLAWAPRRRAQDYAIQGTAEFGPVGRIRTLEGGYDPGLRVGAGYRLPGEGLELMAVYTHWHSAAEETISAAAGERLFPTLTHPAFVTEVDAAAASNSVNLNVVDFEIGRRFEVSETTQARAFFGPRYANLDQKFHVLYRGTAVGNDVVRRNLTFDGGGLRVGGEANFKFLEHVGLFLRGSGSLMAGRLRSRLTETGNGLAVVDIDERVNRIVPTMDLGIGLSYQRGGMRLSVGYEFHNWFGVAEGLDVMDDVAPGKIGRRAGDLGFDGMFFRCELSF